MSYFKRITRALSLKLTLLIILCCGMFSGVQAQELIYNNGRYDIANATFNSIALSVSAQETFPISMIFNDDGSKLYVMGTNGDDINQYDLSTNYDISTAVFNSISLSVAAQETFPSSMVFNDDGSKLYVMGTQGQNINQYDLSTNYDISTAVFNNIALSVAAQEVSPHSMIFNDDGSKLYVMGTFGKDINQYDLSTNYDISTSVFNSIALSVAAQEQSPTSMLFNADGSKLYVMGANGDDINQYDLSTNYDISSTAFNSIALSVLTQETVPFSMLFNADGSKLYVMGSDGDDINQYDMPFLKYVENGANDGSIDNSNTLIITLAGETFTGANGSDLVAAGKVTVGNVPPGLTTVLTKNSDTEVELTFTGTATAHQNTDDVADITFAFNNTAFTGNNTSNVSNSGSSVAFSSNVGIDFEGNSVLTYNSRYNIANATFNNIALSVAAQVITPISMLFNADGSKLYVLDLIFRDITQYDLSTNYDISTAVFNSVPLSVAGQESLPRAMIFNNDGSKLYVTGSDGADINQYNLSSNYDVSTAVFNSIALDISTEETVPTSMLFNNDGSKLYVLGVNGDDINQYNLSSNYDISTAVFIQIAKSVAGQEINATDMLFNSIGSKLYVMGSDGDDINQYDLSTRYDISTAVFNSIALDISTEETTPLSILFNDDGSKLYVMGADVDGINQYDISPQKYIENIANDGSIDNSDPLTINLVGEIFTGAIGSDLVAAGKVTLGNVPAGLTAVLTKISVTEVELSFAGMATAHQNADDVADITFAFNNTAFTSNNANAIINSGSVVAFSTNVGIDFIDAELTYNSGGITYLESFVNDGSIVNNDPLTITLAGETFTGAIGSDLVAAGRVAVGNIPAGLTAVLTKISATELELTLTGMATAHQRVNNVADITFVFGHAAFTNFTANTITNSGNTAAYSSNVGIVFLDAQLIYHNGTNDIASATFNSIALSVAGQEIAPRSMIFNDNGSKLYVIGAVGSDINQYNLSTNYDVSTAVFIQIAKSVVAEETLPESMLFNNDGSKLYVLGDNDDDINQYDLSTNYNIATAVFNSVVLSVAGQETAPRDMIFNNNGSKLYVMGDAGDNINQYNLSTNYDISTAVFNSIPLSLAGQESFPRSMIFNIDGSKFYVLGTDGDDINQYDLSTRYDISTAVFNTIALNINTEESFPVSMIFNDDHSKLYVLGVAGFDINQYDNSTLKYLENVANDGSIDNSNSLRITLEDDTFTGANGSDLVADGKVTVNSTPAGLTAVLTKNSNTEVELTYTGMARAHQSINNVADITFAFNDAAFTINNASAIINSGSTVAFSSNVEIDFFDNSDLTYHNGSYDVINATFNSVVLSVAAQETNPRDMLFNDDGSKLYVLGLAGDDINQYNLSTNYDISTAVFNNSVLDVSAQETAPFSMLFNNNGQTLCAGR